MNSRLIGIAGAFVAIVATPAFAGDVSYADRQGNLVVESAAGYKRIIVGQGKAAGDLANYLGVARVTPEGDIVAADSQGNVTIQSADGYKRILVGRADDLDSIAASMGADEVVNAPPRFDSGYAGRSNPVVCAPPDGVIKGRSYMYGLPQGATPVIVNCQ